MCMSACACACQRAQNSAFATDIAPYFDDIYSGTYNIGVRGANFTGNFRALYLDTLQQPASVAGSIFQGNEAIVEPGTGGAGAGLYMIGSFYAYITVTDCQFTRNSSPFLGGAIFALSFLFQHTVSDCSIEGNYAAVSGGGIAMVDGSLTVNNSRVSNNVAGADGGGGITCRDCVALTLVNTSLTGNACQEVGGAIKVSGLPASDVMLDQVNATGNM